MRLLLLGLLGIFVCCAAAPARAGDTGVPHIVRMGVKKPEPQKVPLAVPDKGKVLLRLSGQKNKDGQEKTATAGAGNDAGTVDEKQKPLSHGRKFI
ncbi:MAG: hypothetical protein H6867_09345 [Rhodospirillales bacterium]|nr:hypothetical protein [Rhodospirillales bacterium]